MTPTEPATPTELTFEDGYKRLQEIADRLSQEEVPVSEMCNLFAEGKGLESALTGYLDTQKLRVESIERGEGIHEFRIVDAQAGGAEEQATPSARQIPLETAGFVPTSDFGSGPRSGVADDDIPF